MKRKKATKVPTFALRMTKAETEALNPKYWKSAPPKKPPKSIAERWIKPVGGMGLLLEVDYPGLHNEYGDTYFGPGGLWLRWQQRRGDEQCESQLIINRDQIKELVKALLELERVHDRLMAECRAYWAAHPEEYKKIKAEA